MKTCAKCGFQNEENAKFCAKCGGALESAGQQGQAGTANNPTSVNVCPKCGTTYQGNFCPKGCNSNAVKKKMKGWQVALIVVACVFGGLIVIGALANAFGEPTETLDASSSKAAVVANANADSSSRKLESKAASSEKVSSFSIEQARTRYKSLCESYNYKSIARDPEKYKGKYAKFTGEVSQVLESGTRVVLRVNVTRGEYDIWTDTMYVEYLKNSADESRILEDDIVTIYGQLDGIETYTAVLGNEISIPRIDAMYIDITN